MMNCIRFPILTVRPVFVRSWCLSGKTRYWTIPPEICALSSNRDTRLSSIAFQGFSFPCGAMPLSAFISSEAELTSTPSASPMRSYLGKLPLHVLHVRLQVARECIQRVHVPEDCLEEFHVHSQLPSH